jgi:hypothetical protein
MGYTTEFQGRFELDRMLDPAHEEYLREFNRTRRMKRNAQLANDLPDPVRIAAGLDVGPEGAYFVGAGGDFGQGHTPDVEDYNQPPEGQPGLWCKWTPDSGGLAIIWDGVEKFYDYVAWIEYLLKHFLIPWGYQVNGVVRWRGEEFCDTGSIVVENNRVHSYRG